jgi:D-alanyl-D-alanine-carboxypeptidase/D-alanyl-D-alanine-endopeptidase
VSWADDTAVAIEEAFVGAFDEGVVVASAVIDPSGSQLTRPASVPHDARFEIGSITKTMTALVLASMVEQRQLDLDDKIGTWLAAGENGDITVSQLATHTSGLPRLAPNHETDQSDRANPYARFTAEQAESGLRQSTRSAAGIYEYSNFGYQLLGLALERAAGRSFEALLQEIVFAPLGMGCSGVGEGGGGTRLAGHARGREVPHWDQPLAGAGGVETTVDDLARYVAAQMRLPDNQLGAAMRMTHAPLASIGVQRKVGLGWSIRDRRLLSHNGGTGGFSASVVIDPVEGRAVALLANGGAVTDTLEAAALLALTGRDPQKARPQPIGTEWDDRARRLVTCFVKNRSHEIYATMTSGFQTHVSPKQLRQVWKLSTLGAGPVGDVAVECRRIPAGVAADVTVAFAGRPVRLSIAFNSSGQVTGLKILRPNEEAPW